MYWLKLISLGHTHKDYVVIYLCDLCKRFSFYACDTRKFFSVNSLANYFSNHQQSAVPTTPTQPPSSLTNADIRSVPFLVRKSHFTEEDELILLREVFTWKENIVASGEDREQFYKASTNEDLNPYLSIYFNEKIIQDLKYPRLFL